MNHRVYGGKLGAEPGASTGQHGTSLQNCQWWEMDDNDGRGQGEKKERRRILLGRCAYSAYWFPVQFLETRKKQSHFIYGKYTHFSPLSQPG